MLLPFDQVAAAEAAWIAARRRAGRPVEFRDVQIAGIAAARVGLRSPPPPPRNTRHFEGVEAKVVNPWLRG